MTAHVSTIGGFTWERVDRCNLDATSVTAERNLHVDNVPGDTMRMCLQHVHGTQAIARTQRDGFTPVYYVGSRLLTAAEFGVVADPHRYGFQFVSLVRSGLDLVCTPWSYRHAWEGPGARRGEPVKLTNALTVRRDARGDARGDWVGFADFDVTLACVCAMANHDTHGYTLRLAESGRAWSLEISSTHRLWCSA